MPEIYKSAIFSLVFGGEAWLRSWECCIAVGSHGTGSRGSFFQVCLQKLQTTGECDRF